MLLSLSGSVTHLAAAGEVQEVPAALPELLRQGRPRQRRDVCHSGDAHVAQVAVHLEADAGDGPVPAGRIRGRIQGASMQQLRNQASCKSKNALECNDEGRATAWDPKLLHV